MEEDIKVIKEQIYTADGEKMDYIDIDNVIHNECDNFIKAIENLIKGYKELEEELKRQSIAIIEYQDLLENSIPKSKVKEIIEDIDNNKPVIAELKLRKLVEGDD